MSNNKMNLPEPSPKCLNNHAQHILWSCRIPFPMWMSQCGHVRRTLNKKVTRPIPPTAMCFTEHWIPTCSLKVTPDWTQASGLSGEPYAKAFFTFLCLCLPDINQTVRAVLGYLPWIFSWSYWKWCSCSSLIILSSKTFNSRAAAHLWKAPGVTYDNND